MIGKAVASATWRPVQQYKRAASDDHKEASERQ
jgi:hypothetical protein